MGWVSTHADFPMCRIRIPLVNLSLKAAITRTLLIATEFPTIKIMVLMVLKDL